LKTIAIIKKELEQKYKVPQEDLNKKSLRKNDYVKMLVEKEIGSKLKNLQPNTIKSPI